MRNEMVKKEAEESKGKLNDAIKALCPMIYDGKCFIPVVLGRGLNYDVAVAICESLGGHLANIYSQIHMDEVMKYIRETRMGGSTGRFFRLGMKYDPKAKKLTLRDGSDAPAGLKWMPGYPDGAYTNVILWVNSDQSSSRQHLYNFHPWTPVDVLCEIV